MMAFPLKKLLDVVEKWDHAVADIEVGTGIGFPRP